MIYQHRATVTTAAGSSASTTLNVVGGLAQQLLIRALTSAATVFRADITDGNSLLVRNYGFHEYELNDVGMSFPMAGVYTLNITNASPNDTFSILLAVQEVR